MGTDTKRMAAAALKSLETILDANRHLPPTATTIPVAVATFNLIHAVLTRLTNDEDAED